MESFKDNETFSGQQGCLNNSDIMSRCDNEMITDGKNLSILFNKHYTAFRM